MYIGTVLKNIREEQGFSLLEIQKKTGIKESQLCRIESGIRFPTDDQIFILAKFYNIDSNQLQIQRESDKILESYLTKVVSIATIKKQNALCFIK